VIALKWQTIGGRTPLRMLTMLLPVRLRGRSYANVNAAAKQKITISNSSTTFELSQTVCHHVNWHVFSFYHQYLLFYFSDLTSYVNFLSVFFKQQTQLSPSDRAMHLVSSNLANYHATVQKLLIRQVLTKPMV